MQGNSNYICAYPVFFLCFLCVLPVVSLCLNALFVCFEHMCVSIQGGATHQGLTPRVGAARNAAVTDAK